MKHRCHKGSRERRCASAVPRHAGGPAAPSPGNSCAVWVLGRAVKGRVEMEFIVSLLFLFPSGECRAARARLNGEALRRQRGKAQLEDSQQEHIGPLTALPDLATNYASFIGRAERGSGSGATLPFSSCLWLDSLSFIWCLCSVTRLIFFLPFVVCCNGFSSVGFGRSTRLLLRRCSCECLDPRTRPEQRGQLAR